MISYWFAFYFSDIIVVCTVSIRTWWNHELLKRVVKTRYCSSENKQKCIATPPCVVEGRDYAWVACKIQTNTNSGSGFSVKEFRQWHCKRQKWKEQVKVSKCRKFGDWILKTGDISEGFKNKKIARNSKREYMGVCMGLRLGGPNVKFR